MAILIVTMSQPIDLKYQLIETPQLHRSRHFFSIIRIICIMQCGILASWIILDHPQVG